MRKVIVRILASVFAGVIIASIGVIYDKNNTPKALECYEKRISSNVWCWGQ